MTKEEIIESDWYVARECQYDLCDNHGCDDCLHEGRSYLGCTYCSQGVLCLWIEK